MIKPQCFELLMSRSNCHGPKDVRAIEVPWYISRASVNKPKLFTGVSEVLHDGLLL